MRNSLQANPTCVQLLSEYNLATERHQYSLLDRHSFTTRKSTLMFYLKHIQLVYMHMRAPNAAPFLA